MMEQYYQLTELLFRLIKVQIEKYTGLANIGVGPDAGINGYLVVDQVNELLQFTQTLMDMIQSENTDDTVFKSILSQTQFYLHQEYLRGHAGWLIDDNNIHNAEYTRLLRCKNELTALIDEHEIKDIPAAIATNDIQRQCEHDSHAIAFHITYLATSLMNHPDMVLDDTIVPAHAAQILRRHARQNGRYDQQEIFGEIVRIQKTTNDYLEKSTRQTSSTRLSKDVAAKFRIEHESRFNRLLTQYKTYQPDSSLFSNNPEWYDIAAKTHMTPHLQSGLRSQGLFKPQTLAVFAVGALAIALVILNLATMTNQPDKKHGL